MFQRGPIRLSYNSGNSHIIGDEIPCLQILLSTQSDSPCLSGSQKRNYTVSHRVIIARLEDPALHTKGLSFNSQQLLERHGCQSSQYWSTWTSGLTQYKAVLLANGRGHSYEKEHISGWNMCFASRRSQIYTWESPGRTRAWNSGLNIDVFIRCTCSSVVCHMLEAQTC